MTGTPPLSPNALSRTKRDWWLSKDKDKSINKILYVGFRFPQQGTFGSSKIVSLGELLHDDVKEQRIKEKERTLVPGPTTGLSIV
jgi:hypothetical protein